MKQENNYQKSSGGHVTRIIPCSEWRTGAEQRLTVRKQSIGNSAAVWVVCPQAAVWPFELTFDMGAPMIA